MGAVCLDEVGYLHGTFFLTAAHAGFFEFCFDGKSLLVSVSVGFSLLWPSQSYGNEL